MSPLIRLVIKVAQSLSIFFIPFSCRDDSSILEGLAKGLATLSIELTAAYSIAEWVTNVGFGVANRGGLLIGADL